MQKEVAEYIRKVEWFVGHCIRYSFEYVDRANGYCVIGRYLSLCNVTIQVGIVEALLTLLACSIVIIIAALIGTIIAKLFDI